MLWFRHLKLSLKEQNTPIKTTLLCYAQAPSPPGSARYTGARCSPAAARPSDFPVTPGAAMPPVAQCQKTPGRRVKACSNRFQVFQGPRGGGVNERVSVDSILMNESIYQKPGPSSKDTTCPDRTDRSDWICREL